MRMRALAIGALAVLAPSIVQAQGAPSLPAARVDKIKVAPPKTTPDLKSTLYKMADVLGMLRGAQEEDSILTLEYFGTGTVNVGGKPCTATSYRGSLRFNGPGMRVDFSCAGQPPQRHIQVVARTFAWDEIQPGKGATPAPGSVNDRLLQVWTIPQGIVKAAIAASANTKVTLEGGVVYVTFPLPVPLVGTARAALNTTDVMVLTLDNGDKYELTNLIDRLETRVGDIVTETTFSNYADWNEADYKSDILFPGRIVQKRNGVTVLDLTITKTNTYNPYVIMPVPENIQKAAGR